MAAARDQACRPRVSSIPNLMPAPQQADVPAGVFPFHAEDNEEFSAEVPGVVELTVTLTDADGG
jgi:hypothetical protein